MSPAPTTGIFLNSATPAAPSGNQNVKPQSDGGTPQQSISFYPQKATSSLLGVVQPDGTTVTVDSDGVLSVDASALATKAGVQQESYVYAADTGAANAYAVSLTPTPTIVAGSEVVFKAAHANTGASTLAVNGGGAIAIYKSATVALAAGDIAAGQIVRVVYDGSAWQMSASGALPSGTEAPVIRGSAMASSAATSSFAISLPSGSVAGDLALLFCGAENTSGAGQPPTMPSGWTQLFVYSDLLWATTAGWKILTSGDITAGSVTVTAAEGEQMNLAMVTFIGPTGGIREVESQEGSGPNLTLTNTTSSAVLDTDAAIYWSSMRLPASGYTLTPASGTPTLLQSESTNSLSYLYDQEMPGGALAVTNYWAASGSGACAQVIVKGVPIASGVVSSLNGETGALSLVAGSGVTIAASGSSIEISASGGGSSPLTTKGDLYGYGSADARIPVGSDGDVLTADSTQTLGLKWAAGSGGSGVSSFNSRTGAVVPASGDYTAAEVTDAADTSAASNVFAGAIEATGFLASGDPSPVASTVALIYAGGAGGLLAFGANTSTIASVALEGESSDKSLTQLYLYATPSGIALYLPVLLAEGYVCTISSSAGLASNGTIAIGSPVSLVAPTGNVTGVILTAGSTAGQVQAVINNSSHTITFAASGTSHVADGTSDAIPANAAREFIWSGTLWYRKG